MSRSDLHREVDMEATKWQALLRRHVNVSEGRDRVTQGEIGEEVG